MIISEVRHLRQLKGELKTSLQIAAFFANNVEKNAEKMKLETHFYSNYVYSLLRENVYVLQRTSEKSLLMHLSGWASGCLIYFVRG